MSAIVKAGKTAKNILKSAGLIKNEHRVTYVRRIERIRTDKRICAMTFDDGPMNMPPSPDNGSGKCLTEILLDTLKKYSAHATFDIVGYTGENYPDKEGKLGSASWGGKKYDHYPDIHADKMGGAVNCQELVRRMIDEGHEIANHGYRHVIFGKKPFVYGKREHFNSIDEVIDDLRKLHMFVKNEFDYEIKLSRPPHYVDRIDRYFTSYDAYALMGYGYMAASFDGGGWLPSGMSDAAAAQKDETNAMIKVISDKLAENPDFFCGQIIFGKDGYNMSKRTPVAYALDKQLELLCKYGYRVVSVSELMSESPFADVGRECGMLEELSRLSLTHAVAYSDNTLRLDAKMTNYEYAMLICPKNTVLNERIDNIKKKGVYISEYDAALEFAKKNQYINENASGKSILKILADGSVNEHGFTRREVLERFVKENMGTYETLTD